MSYFYIPLNRDKFKVDILDLSKNKSLIDTIKSIKKSNFPSYYDKLDFYEKSYGTLVKYLILVINHTDTINKASSVVYYESGLADGGISRDILIPTHKEMCELTRIFSLHKIDICKDVLELLEEFEIEVDENTYESENCEVCGGSGFDEEGIEECSSCTNGKVEVPNIDHGEIINLDHLNELDAEFNLISKSWLIEVVGYFTDVYENRISESTILSSKDKIRCSLAGTMGDINRIKDKVKATLTKGGRKDECDEFNKRTEKMKSYDYPQFLNVVKEYIDIV